MNAILLVALAFTTVAPHSDELALGGRNLKTISLEQAKKLVDRFQEIYLDQCTEISVPCLDVLIDGSRELSLNGLRSITPEQANILCRAGCFAVVSLDGLRNIPQPILKILSGCSCEVSLGGIKKLDLEQSDIIKDFKRVCLNGLESLDPKVAENISQKKSRLIKLNGLKSIDPESLLYLMSSYTEVHLGGLKELTENQAKIAARCESYLHLDGIHSLSDDLFLQLNNCRSQIYMTGITSLWPKQSFEYRNGSGRLRFDRLLELDVSYLDSISILGLRNSFFPYVKTISIDVAKNLGGFNWHLIGLHSLSEINPEQAYWLGMGGGLLNLSGLRRIDVISAKHLARFLGELDLSGLREITPEVAQALGGHIGNLRLCDLREVDETCARKLENHVGSVHLDSIRSISDRAFRHLTNIRNLSFYEVAICSTIETRIKMAFFYYHIFIDTNTIDYHSWNSLHSVFLPSLDSLTFSQAIACIFLGKNKVSLEPKKLTLMQLTLLCLSGMHLDYSALDSPPGWLRYLPLCLHNGSICLPVNDKLNLIDYFLISFNRGEIKFGNIDKLDDMEAWAMRNHKGRIIFYSLNSISLTQVEILAQHDGQIRLPRKIFEESNSHIQKILECKPFVIR